jgi:hypothetical protein
VLDRLLTPEFRDRRPDLAFLFQQMGTFNTAKMADLRNLGSDGPTFEELDAAPFPLLLAGERDSGLSPAGVTRGRLLPFAAARPAEANRGPCERPFAERPVLAG